MKSISIIAYMALTANAQGPIDVVPAPTYSTFPFTQGKHPIVMTTTQNPEDVGWRITGKTDEAIGISCSKLGYPSHFGEQPAEDCPLKQGKYELQCLDNDADGWHGGYLVIDGKRYCDDFIAGHSKVVEFSICHDPLPITQKTLDEELDYFSRSFDKHHYFNAMNVYAELKKKGQEPVTGPNGVHTWDLYDKAFPFEKVRRYDLVQQHMDEIQHFQDNLNQNLQNGQAVDQFIIVGRAAQAALNHKYSGGEFVDPATYDPEDPHPATWASTKFGI